MVESNFSFVRFVKYVLRYFWVAVLCVVIGVGACIPMVLKKDVVNYERYIGRITFDLTQYAALVKAEGDYTDGEFSVIATQLSQVTEEVRTSGVLSNTFDCVVDKIYPELDSKKEKQELFFENLFTWNGVNAVNVAFHYDVREASDREIAHCVIDAYYEQVREVVTKKYPELSGDAYYSVVTESSVLRDYNLPNDVIAKNTEDSSLVTLFLGAVVGGMGAAAILFLMYLFTSRIKCVEEVLPLERSAVILADRDDAVYAFLARVETAKARRIAVMTLQKDDAFDAWCEKLQGELAKTGLPVKTIKFTADGTEWLSYFKSREQTTDGYELYLYNDGVGDIATYIAEQADLSAFFVDQKRVSAKALADGVKNISDGRYDCTVLHGLGRSYVG